MAPLYSVQSQGAQRWITQFYLSFHTSLFTSVIGTVLSFVSSKQLRNNGYSLDYTFTRSIVALVNQSGGSDAVLQTTGPSSGRSRLLCFLGAVQRQNTATDTYAKRLPLIFLVLSYIEAQQKFGSNAYCVPLYSILTSFFLMRYTYMHNDIPKKLSCGGGCRWTPSSPQLCSR